METIPFNIIDYVEEQVTTHALENLAFEKDFHADVRIADSRFGDFQINGVLAYAQRKKKNPRNLANDLKESLWKENVLEAGTFQLEVAGPGFINVQLSSTFLLEWVQAYGDEETLRKGQNSKYVGKRISIDYSSPNIAKQMHVGHMRSMFIGESIQRLLRFQGANVIRDNHLGDWGTQFGILIMAIKVFKYDLGGEAKDPIEDLEELYRKGRELFDRSLSYKEMARQELVRLQEEEEENFELWQKINEISYKAFEKIYDLLNISFDVVQGESFYRKQVERVYKELTETEIAKESEGALVVFHPTEQPDEAPYPFIIRKKDGASNYCTTDLATILYHSEKNHIEEMLYIVGAPQRDHFRYLFQTAKLWFKAKGYRLPELRHIAFGSILGEDGKAIKTRSGQPIKLKELLEEAIERAYQVVDQKNPDLADTEKKHIAKVIGLGAIRYADLAQNRISDYVFSWDKILSFEGNTAPYLLYAIARLYSLFRKANENPTGHWSEASTFETGEERTLAKKLIELPCILKQTVNELKPHILCNYLYDLASIFSGFYNTNKVITEDKAVTARRLLLCSRTLKFLETGLYLLGLETLKKM